MGTDKKILLVLYSPVSKEVRKEIFLAVESVGPLILRCRSAVQDALRLFCD